MRAFRLALWIAIGVLLGAVGYVTLFPEAGRKAVEIAGASIGGPFTLTRSDGRPFSDKDFGGKPFALFFGFTRCPEVCPTTLWEASGWLQKLGADADRLTFAFVSVDPERDTAAELAQYMSAFDPRIVGLTGTVEQVEAIKKAYRVYSRKVPTDGGDYTVDHTATIYLMHGDGRFSGTIAWRENADSAIAKLARLAREG
jgi:protein SCO1/2